MRSLLFKSGICLVFILLVIGLFSLPVEAGVTLKITVVNPSEQKQSVPVKVYLPVEAKPQDIIAKDDLEIAYDTQQGSYYVFGDYELEPQGILEREIEINDIWLVPELEIEVVRQEAKKLKDYAEKTDVAQSVNLVYNKIERSLTEINDLQKIPAASPTQHISDYRYCLSLLASAKTDLAQCRSILAQTRAKPGIAATIWKIILFVIIFLAILGLSSYIIWQRQAKLANEVNPALPKEDTDFNENTISEDKQQNIDKKPASSEDDIEDIIRKNE